MVVDLTVFPFRFSNSRAVSLQGLQGQTFSQDETTLGLVSEQSPLAPLGQLGQLRKSSLGQSPLGQTSLGQSGIGETSLGPSLNGQENNSRNSSTNLS